MTRRQKVALNIAILAICIVIGMASILYLVIDFFNYFIEIETMPESISLILLAWIVLAFCSWLGFFSAKNLFGKQFKKLRRQSKRMIKNTIKTAKEYLKRR